MAIFDQYKIAIVKQKAKLTANSRPKPRHNVFGVNLSTLLMRDMPKPTDSIMVPEVFRLLIEYLTVKVREDGILRVAGQKQKLEYLCQEIENKFYDDKQAVYNLLNEITTHDLTGILKKLLRDLPDPIFTVELFDMFYKCSCKFQFF